MTGTAPASAAQVALQVLLREAEALQEVAEHLRGDSSGFDAALGVALGCVSRGGKVVLAGVGKSAMLTSMGTLAIFMHPSEALHGDLGIIGPEDVLLLVSYSGESPEIISMLGTKRVQGCAKIAVCGNSDSTIVRLSDAWLNCAVKADNFRVHEAWDEMPVPTCSSTATLALGDAFAVALTHARGVTGDVFIDNHPGGALGIQFQARYL